MDYVKNEKDLKEAIASNKVLITYVKDVCGFKIGVVVAIGAGCVGYSAINEKMEQSTECKVGSAPVWQNLKQAMLHGKNYIYMAAELDKYLNWLGDGIILKKPTFDRKKALMLAINRAVGAEKGEGLVANIPSNIAQDFLKMIDRSHAYFAY